jgi:hypothetical protein
MIEGVTKGYEKSSRSSASAGRPPSPGQEAQARRSASPTRSWSHPRGPDGHVDKQIVKVSGADRSSSGSSPRPVRAKRKPEPYNGKGIKYTDRNDQAQAGQAVRRLITRHSQPCRPKHEEVRKATCNKDKHKTLQASRRRIGIRKRISGTPSARASRSTSPSTTSTPRSSTISPGKTLAAASSHREVASSGKTGNARRPPRRRQAPRRAAKEGRCHQGGLRPRRVQVPRARQGPRRRGPQGRSEVLT